MPCEGDFRSINRRAFRIIAFDWDGTAVRNRKVDAGPVTAVLEELLKLGVYVAVVTGTNFGNIDRQFCSRIKGEHKKKLYVCTNRGSEVYGFDDSSQPVLIFRRKATAAENQLLDKVAEAVRDEIESRSDITIDIVYDRLNRRKIDLIPEWPDPPKSRIGELIDRTQRRLQKGGFKSGIKGAYRLAEEKSAEIGLTDPRITSDVKHIEVGLTDKSDSIKWIIEEIAGRYDVPLDCLLVLGDEFGPVAGFDGSDYHMVLPGHEEITYVTVGKEPNGVPAKVTRVGGGPACFVDLMKAQVALRGRLALTRDSTFLLTEEGFNPLREREIESLFAVSNGYVGTRGSLEERNRYSGTATLIAGVYDAEGPEGLEQLAIAPDWLLTQIYVFGRRLTLGKGSIIEHRRMLDMEKGVYRRYWRHRDRNGRVTSIHFLRFASLADPHALVMRVSLMTENYSAMVRVETGLALCEGCRTPLQMLDETGDGTLTMLATTADKRIKVAMAQKTNMHLQSTQLERSIRTNDSGVFEDLSWQAEVGQVFTMEKFVSIFTSRDTKDPVARANRHVTGQAGRGLTEQLLDHIDAWEERWQESAITLSGEPAARRALNFSTYHLISAGNPRDEKVSVSARALTGTIYRGHIFWDAEIFTLPFFIFTHPPTARAILMYRYHTLAVAKKNAAEAGYRGAMFAWESAETGKEMTPRTVLSPSGELVPVNSGEFEDHIIADIAYAVWYYWNATGDQDFMLKAGAELLVETARFWVSRATKKGGYYHLLRVEGPDEYHDQGVDDNYYTNAMAAWNIEHALEAVSMLKDGHREDWRRLRDKTGLKPAELRRWAYVASHMYGVRRSGRRANSVIEEFTGYFGLEDINVHDYEPRTAPLDVILGHERVLRTQIVKQADVIMAMYLLERQNDAETVRENFNYYDRRTDHGSSLSLAIYGLVAARLGRMDRAIAYFRRARRIDLANNMGNAAGGVHLAAMGGLWQQVIMGFGGVRTEDDRLYLDPRLPAKWSRLGFKLLWRGQSLSFDIRRNQSLRLKLPESGKISVGICGRRVRKLSGAAEYISLWDGEGWGAFSRDGKKEANGGRKSRDTDSA